MNDPRLVKMAQIMVRYSTEVKKGDRVIIRGFPLEVVLHHEIMHHILNVFIDPPTSYDYDNISPNGKIDRFAVCDDLRTR